MGRTSTAGTDWSPLQRRNGYRQKICVLSFNEVELLLSRTTCEERTFVVCLGETNSDVILSITQVVVVALITV